MEDNKVKEAQDEIGLFPYIILTTAKVQIDADIQAEEDKINRAKCLVVRKVLLPLQ